MKVLIWIFCCVVLGRTAIAQYYFKDIVSTEQNLAKWKSYQKNRVKLVELTSIEASGQPSEGFEGKQEVSADFSTITTFTHSNMAVPSELIAYYDPGGLLKKTLDTSDTYQSATEYGYDPSGHILSVMNVSLETDNQVKDVEKHLWRYNSAGLPVSMLKIKNEVDTTYVEFVLDEKGDVVEERSVHGTQKLPVIYYYYDNAHHLTDLVRYSQMAQRMLPDYIYEYASDGKITSMIFVPEGSSDYQKWLYQYDEKGLKTEEACFDKRRELMGKIQYEYSFYK
jgi:hypothetical protein